MTLGKPQTEDVIQNSVKIEKDKERLRNSPRLEDMKGIQQPHTTWDPELYPGREKRTLLENLVKPKPDLYSVSSIVPMLVA